MLQFSSSQTSNLRWRYFVESLLLKSTPNVSSVVLSSARVAGVDRADARASSVAREPPRGRNTPRRRRRSRWRAGWCRGSLPRPWRSVLASAASPASFFTISYFGGFLHRGGVSRLVASRERRVSDRYRREICNCLRRSVAPSQITLMSVDALK